MKFRKVFPPQIPLQPMLQQQQQQLQSNWGGYNNNNMGYPQYGYGGFGYQPQPQMSPNGEQPNIQICQKNQRIGCIIPHCKFQRGITQPIIWFFWHVCTAMPFTFMSGISLPGYYPPQRNYPYETQQNSPQQKEQIQPDQPRQSEVSSEHQRMWCTQYGL